MTTFKSFAALAASIKADAYEAQRNANLADVRKAKNLARSSAIARKTKGTGPRIAR